MAEDLGATASIRAIRTGSNARGSKLKTLFTKAAVCIKKKNEAPSRDQICGWRNLWTGAVLWFVARGEAMAAQGEVFDLTSGAF